MLSSPDSQVFFKFNYGTIPSTALEHWSEIWSGYVPHRADRKIRFNTIAVRLLKFNRVFFVHNPQLNLCFWHASLAAAQGRGFSSSRFRWNIYRYFVGQPVNEFLKRVDTSQCVNIAWSSPFSGIRFRIFKNNYRHISRNTRLKYKESGADVCWKGKVETVLRKNFVSNQARNKLLHSGKENLNF